MVSPLNFAYGGRGGWNERIGPPLDPPLAMRTMPPMLATPLATRPPSTPPARTRRKRPGLQQAALISAVLLPFCARTACSTIGSVQCASSRISDKSGITLGPARVKTLQRSSVTVAFIVCESTPLTQGYESRSRCFALSLFLVTCFLYSS